MLTCYLLLRGPEGLLPRPGALSEAVGKRIFSLVQELLANGVLAEDGNHVVSKEDHTFRAPGGAAVVLLGCPANGWKEWKSKFGGTLGQLNRQVTDDTGGQHAQELMT